MHLNNVGSLWLRRYAVFVAFCTFGLLIAGGLVTSNDAALSVPDWPLSWGHLVPTLQGGIRYEFAHRAAAMLVALLTVALAIKVGPAPASVVQQAPASVVQQAPAAVVGQASAAVVGQASACQSERSSDSAPYIEPGTTSITGLGRLLCNLRDSLAWNWKSSATRSCTL